MIPGWVTHSHVFHGSKATVPSGRLRKRIPPHRAQMRLARKKEELEGDKTPFFFFFFRVVVCCLFFCFGCFFCLVAWFFGLLVNASNLFKTPGDFGVFLPSVEGSKTA